MKADQVALIRSLKGAPCSIILALLITGRSLTNKQLCTITGYSDKTITAALDVLEMHQFTQFNGRAYGWSLSAGQLQLNLPEQLSTGYPQIDRKFSDLDALTTTTTIQIKDQESTLHTGEKKVVEEEEGRSENFRSSSKRSEFLRSTLEAAGVGPSGRLGALLAVVAARAGAPAKRRHRRPTFVHGRSVNSSVARRGCGTGRTVWRLSRIAGRLLLQSSLAVIVY
jgi:hypothetical protein